LPSLVGVVSGGPEPVTERGHLPRAGATACGVVGHLAEAIGLGDPCTSAGYCPVNRVGRLGTHASDPV